MINPFAEVNWKPGRPELRKFGRDLLVVGGVLAIGMIVRGTGVL